MSVGGWYGECWTMITNVTTFSQSCTTRVNQLVAPRVSFSQLPPHSPYRLARAAYRMANELGLGQLGGLTPGHSEAFTKSTGIGRPTRCKGNGLLGASHSCVLPGRCRSVSFYHDSFFLLLPRCPFLYCRISPSASSSTSSTSGSSEPPPILPFRQARRQSGCSVTCASSRRRMRRGRTIGGVRSMVSLKMGALVVRC